MDNNSIMSLMETAKQGAPTLPGQVNIHVNDIDIFNEPRVPIPSNAPVLGKEESLARDESLADAMGLPKSMIGTPGAGSTSGF